MGLSCGSGSSACPFLLCSKELNGVFVVVAIWWRDGSFELSYGVNHVGLRPDSGYFTFKSGMHNTAEWDKLPEILNGFSLYCLALKNLSELL